MVPSPAATLGAHERRPAAEPKGIAPVALQLCSGTIGLSRDRSTLQRIHPTADRLPSSEP
ncbi:MAG: hypothetical protein QOF30_1681, partial [Acidimicrobiaceae bacterium]|nr:hypothetical protein [Acidimicrobiaceae bacterium]